MNARTDERHGIFGVEWVTTHGLLSRGAEGNVHAAVIGQDNHLQIGQLFWRSS